MTDEDAPGGDDGTRSGADLHAALSSAVLRRVLYYFRARQVRTGSLGELADALVAAGDVVDDATAAEVRLHHCTLPKLDEIGAIDYDPETRTVRYHGHDGLESRLAEEPGSVPG